MPYIIYKRQNALSWRRFYRSHFLMRKQLPLPEPLEIDRLILYYFKESR